MKQLAANGRAEFSSVSLTQALAGLFVGGSKRIAGGSKRTHWVQIVIYVWWLGCADDAIDHTARNAEL